MNQTQQTEAYPISLVPVQADEAILPTTFVNGNEVVAWDDLYKRDATIDMAGALIAHEVNGFRDSGEPKDSERADKIVKATTYILSFINNGQLTNMSEVATAMDLVIDNGPSLAKVQQLLDRGLSIETIALAYDTREELGLSLEKVLEVYTMFNFDLGDEDASGLLSDAIDSVIAHYGIDPRFKETAVSKLISLAQEMTLKDIIDLPKRTRIF